MILIVYAVFGRFLADGKTLVAVYEDLPYVSLGASVFVDLLPLIMRDLNETWEILAFEKEEQALQCVSEGKCGLSLTKFESGVSLTYPAFWVRTR